MRRVAERKQTMLIVAHEMRFACEIADRVIFMRGGKIVQEGAPEQIFGAPKDARLQRFLKRLSHQGLTDGQERAFMEGCPAGGKCGTAFSNVRSSIRKDCGLRNEREAGIHRRLLPPP